MPNLDPSPQEAQTCPDCGEPLIFGYGLTGGGMGSYLMCDACPYFSKSLDKSEEPHE